MVKEANTSNFKEEISKGKVIVDFWAPWCGPCRIFGPVFEETSKELKEVNFLKLNVDDNPDIAQEYEIRGIPTSIIFNDGKEVKRFSGVKSKEELKKELQ
tara:strand:- start:308 stop:607 length:300 start_codon:yes stop_codon:yes gene_type:complete